MYLLLHQLGPMRWILLSLGLCIAAFAPDGQTVEAREGWALVSTVLLPALSPIVLMGLWLDALMSRVWMVESTPEVRSRYTRIFWINLGVSVILIIAFIPFLRTLFN